MLSFGLWLIVVYFLVTCLFLMKMMSHVCHVYQPKKVP